jgi:hypothetical protein
LRSSGFAQCSSVHHYSLCNAVARLVSHFFPIKYQKTHIFTFKKKKKKNKKKKATLINPPSQPKIAAATAMGVKPQPQTIQGAGVKQQPMKTQIAGPTKTKANNLPPPPLSRVPKMKKQKQSARTDPRFGAINSDLMSRAEPYSQIRRTPMPPPRTQFQSRLRLPAPRPGKFDKFTKFHCYF